MTFAYDSDPEDWGRISPYLNEYEIPVLLRALNFFQQKCYTIESHEHKQIDEMLKRFGRKN